MIKKILVISTSIRKCGNSDRLAEEFIRGAKDNGTNVKKMRDIQETLDVINYKIEKVLDLKLN